MCLSVKNAPNPLLFPSFHIKYWSTKTLKEQEQHSHTPCTSCDPSTLLQTLHLALAGALALALHEIIIVRLASCPNEKACG